MKDQFESWWWWWCRQMLKCNQHQLPLCSQLSCGDKKEREHHSIPPLPIRTHLANSLPPLIHFPTEDYCSKTWPPSKKNPSLVNTMDVRVAWVCITLGKCGRKSCVSPSSSPRSPPTPAPSSSPRSSSMSSWVCMALGKCGRKSCVAGNQAQILVATPAQGWATLHYITLRYVTLQYITHYMLRVFYCYFSSFCKLQLCIV